jgi:hypothetical protein
MGYFETENLVLHGVRFGLGTAFGSNWDEGRILFIIVIECLTQVVCLCSRIDKYPSIGWK